MNEGEVWWKLHKITATIVGVVVAAFWFGIGGLLALGANVSSFILLPLALAALGLFLVFSFLWQTQALVRIGSLLESIESGRREAVKPPRQE